MENIKRLIRDVPDFPKKGVIFKDITTLLRNGVAFKRAIDLLGDRYKGNRIDAVVVVEARGFIIGASLAYKIGAGIIPVRKPGKLPAKTIQAVYELEYGKDSLELHADAINPGDQILIVDDVLATGGTTQATAKLVEQLGGEIVEIAFLLELGFLKGREKLKDYKVFSLIQY